MYLCSLAFLLLWPQNPDNHCLELLMLFTKAAQSKIVTHYISKSHTFTQHTHSLILVILSSSFLCAELALHENLSASFFLLISLSWLVNLS